MHNWERLSRWLFYVFAALVVVSCGGGGDGLNLQGVSTDKVQLPAGPVTVSRSGQTTIAVGVLDKDDNFKAGQTVSFSISGPAVLSTGSVVTGALGTANLTLKGNGTLGKGRITARYVDSGNNIREDGVDYEVVDGSLVPSNYVLSGTLSRTVLTTSGADSIATATFELKDPAGAVVPNQKVTFGLLATAVNRGVLSATTGTTDAFGKVSVQVQGLGQSSGSNTLTAVYQDPNESLAVTALSFDIVNGNRIILSADKSELISGGDATNLTATVIAPSGVIVPGTAVSFSVVEKDDVGIQLSGVDPVTSATGQARATLTLTDKSDVSDHFIHVRASIGSGKEFSEVELAIRVTGTTVNVSTPSSNVKIDGTVSVDAVLLNGKGIAIANKDVAFTSSEVADAAGNLLSNTTVRTNSQGRVSLTGLKIKSANADGKAVVTAASLGVTGSVSMDVSSVNFEISKPTGLEDADIAAPATVEVTLRDEANPIGSRQVRVSSTLGSFVTSVATMTDADAGDGLNLGKSTFSLSSSFPGEAIIKAEATDAAGNNTLIATRTINFVSKVPSKLSVQSAVTTLKSGEQTQIIAKVRDAKNNPVKGIRVYFNKFDDPSNGSLKDAFVNTDLNGEAVTTFTAGIVATSADGVKIQASLGEGSPVATATTSLTVGGEAFFLSLATGFTITELNATTYAYPHQVTVTDVEGNPVPNKELVLSVIPSQYRKGIYFYDGLSKVWTVLESAHCSNEDADQDGLLDLTENNGAGVALTYLDYPSIGVDVEDNGDGVLWPGNVVTLSHSKIKTDSNGIATFNVLYGQSYANWVNVRLKVTAPVEGSEAKAVRVFNLLGLADHFKDQAVSPPGGLRSPFGTASSCSDFR